MGSTASRASQENGPASKVIVPRLWVQEVHRNLYALRTFRVMMFTLRHDHPEVFKLVSDVIRGIDNRHGFTHNRNTLDKSHNETTSS